MMISPCTALAVKDGAFFPTRTDILLFLVGWGKSGNGESQCRSSLWLWIEDWKSVGRWGLIAAMQMREAAERVLRADTLEEKLWLPPADALDDMPGPAFLTPDTPGRPAELKIVEKGVRAEFPGVNKLDNDRERGKMMHFLANHELLAAELMLLEAISK